MPYKKPINKCNNMNIDDYYKMIEFYSIDKTLGFKREIMILLKLNVFLIVTLYVIVILIVILLYKKVFLKMKMNYHQMVTN